MALAYSFYCGKTQIKLKLKLKLKGKVLSPLHHRERVLSTDRAQNIKHILQEQIPCSDGEWRSYFIVFSKQNNIFWKNNKPKPPFIFYKTPTTYFICVYEAMHSPQILNIWSRRPGSQIWDHTTRQRFKWKIMRITVPVMEPAGCPPQRELHNPAVHHA